MPVVPGRDCWEFRLRPGERPEDFDHAKVLELIRPWLSGVDVDKLTFLRQASYTFRGVVADRWRNGRVFLLGDAAHLTRRSSDRAVRRHPRRGQPRLEAARPSRAAVAGGQRPVER
jgi:FAD binding domain